MAKTNGKKVLQACGVEAVYTYCEFLLRYITGFSAENGCIIVDENGTTYYTDKRYIEAAQKFFENTDVTPVLGKRAEVLERLKSYASVGISFRETSHVEYLELEKAGLSLQNVDEPLTQSMIVKKCTVRSIRCWTRRIPLRTHIIWRSPRPELSGI